MIDKEQINIDWINKVAKANQNADKDSTIDNPEYSKLNKLKKSNPEAFFYWYKIFEIKTQK